MSVREISAKQAKEIIEQEKAQLIDVREPAEHANLHIPNAKLYPGGRISAKGIEDPEQALIIYCQKGGRGKSACEKLLSENPSLKVYNITGGIEHWQESGFDTQKGTSNVLPLDRQVQLSIGTMLLVFSILALTVAPAFVWAVTFIGMGLFIAGSTGFCGLARVVAMMPWNQRV
jgi:rhodanese-related sulfurtransferase